MKQTQPYAAIVSPRTSAAEAGQARAERYVVELEGRLLLQAGAEPRVLKILDDHPQLARALRVTFEAVELRLHRIALDGDEWPGFRRGLVLCASHALGGQVVVSRPGGWRLTIEACGEQPEPVHHTTERLAGQQARPGHRDRVRFRHEP